MVISYVMSAAAVGQERGMIKICTENEDSVAFPIKLFAELMHENICFPAFRVVVHLQYLRDN